MVDLFFAIIVNVVLWAYIIYCLNNAKEIEYECQSGSKLIIFIFFFTMGFLTYLRIRNFYGLISLASFILASGVYHIIPSGFGNNSIIIMGRRYAFSRIKDMELRKENNRLILSFVYGRKTHLLFASLEQSDMMKAYFDLYMKDFWRIKND